MYGMNQGQMGGAYCLPPVCCPPLATTACSRSALKVIVRIIYSEFVNDINKCNEHGHENDWNARYCELCKHTTFVNDICPRGKQKERSTLNHWYGSSTGEKANDNFI